MMNNSTFEEAFNLLCGDRLGSGASRQVFECRIRPELVVKVEDADWRDFSNVTEMRFWDTHQHYTPIAKWLAPCEYLSPDGRILLQKRCVPLMKDDPQAPTSLPSFLTDTKYQNFGVLDGNVVCMDYGFTISNPNARLRKANWWSE